MSKIYVDFLRENKEIDCSAKITNTPPTIIKNPASTINELKESAHVA